MRCGGWWLRLVVVVSVMLTCGACTWLHGDPAPSPQPAAEPGPGFLVATLPVYRLVTSEYLLDVPSRLVVLQVRLESTGTDSFTARAQDLAIVLPDGTQARVFDAERARILLRRTLIAEADLNYLQRPDHQAGGVSPFARTALAEMISANLLAAGSFGPGEALQGYLVIDTGQAVASLDGVRVELVARRLGDDAPTRYAQQPGSTPIAGQQTQSQ